MKTILLKFSGPLQSWGTDSHFETRHTDTRPSKSGVLGMIAAGLGYHRDDDEGLSRLNTLQYAVRVDQAGQLLRDYQTAKKYKKNGDLERTYVTNRYYLQDAVFLIALSSDDESLIRDVKIAVTHPYFPIFLGRRALPPTADLFQGIYNTDAITLLKEYPWQSNTWYQRKHGNRVPIYADAELLNNDNIHLRNDIAVSFSQIQGRKFSLREEARIFVNVSAIKDKEEHDAFKALGEI